MDLPEYGKYVLVNGIDKRAYNERRWHVCIMDDLEDGIEYREDGTFYWLTENGTKIEDVTYWCELPLIDYNHAADCDCEDCKIKFRDEMKLIKSLKTPQRRPDEVAEMTRVKYKKDE